MKCQKSGGKAVCSNEFRPERAAAFWKNQCEMDEERRLDQPGHRIAPVNDLIERVQLAGIMETVKDERGQTENVEMNRSRRAPPAHENEKPDEEVEQRSDAQIILNRRRIGLRGGDYRGFKRPAIAPHLVTDLGPRPRTEQYPGHIRRAMNRDAADGLHIVALPNSRFRSRGVGYYMPGHHALRRLHPRDAVIGKNVAGTLLEIQDGKNDRRKREKREHDRPKPHLKAIVHPSLPAPYYFIMPARQVPANHRF